MIRRLREGRSDHALGHDARRPFQPRGRIGKMFLAISAVEFRHVLGVGVHDQQMSAHGAFLSGSMLSNAADIGAAAKLMRYGILTASDDPFLEHDLFPKTGIHPASSAGQAFSG